MLMASSVASLGELEEFVRDPKQKVVLFEGCVSQLWLGTGSEGQFEAWRWTPAALIECNKVTKRLEVQVAEAEDELFGGDEHRQTVPMLIGSFLSLAQSKGCDEHWLRRDTGGLRFYVAQSPVSRRRRRRVDTEPLLLSSLFEGLKTPPFVSGAYCVNAWMSAGRSTTTAHFDGNDNVLSVLCGRKVVRYAAHVDVEPVPCWSASPNHAANTFSKLKREVEVLPGQALYLPRGFWHQVDSDPGTVALNVWFRFPGKHVDALFLARASLARDMRREMRKRTLKKRQGLDHRKACFARLAQRMLSRARHLRAARRRMMMVTHRHRTRRRTRRFSSPGAFSSRKQET